MGTLVSVRLASWIVALSAGAAPEATSPLELNFGLHTHESHNEIREKYQPVFEHLEKVLAARLKRPVRIKQRVYEDYRESRQALIDGAMDFMRTGSATYILAQNDITERRRPPLQLIVNQSEDGNVRFRGMIFARTETGIHDLADLRGKSFSFGHEDSSTGSYLAKAALLEAGIHAKDLSHFSYHPNHKQAVEAVVEGRFDGGAAKESAVSDAQGPDSRVALTVIATIDHHIGMPWVARSELKPEIVEGIRIALLTLPPGRWKETTGFGVVEDRSYDYMRRAIEKARLFDAGTTSSSADAPLAIDPGAGATAKAYVTAVCGLVLATALGAAFLWRRRTVPRRAHGLG